MEELVTMKGPVVKVHGELMLVIPLAKGGCELMECARGISEVDGEFLKIAIPESIAEVLEIEEGDQVCVHNSGGRFHIQAVQMELVN